MTLTPEVMARIDGILARAQAQGRGVLYEHEVYAILQTIGLGVPRHRFVHDARDATAEILAAVGHTVMAKIVSPGIPHKQRLGGVKRVSAADPLYVQFVLTQMREEVSSHFAAGGAPTVVIGPEGGFSPEELALVPQRVGLGDRILRVETAALVAAVRATAS